ncbi:hypothetical protein HPP92_013936 [Vanilla planifolia]|uniref:Phosphorylated adapter RNA export protein n=1 Tax=Vanilla planifolia TaxID=51239 RepID=A0A835UVR0_VANPL|nr:hypothetical protein HPP92_013936 [Vanilla planifolia]
MSMGQTECLQLEEDFEDVTLDDDIEMIDAEMIGGESGFPCRESGMPADKATGEGSGGDLGSVSVVDNIEVRHDANPGKKKNRRKKKGRKKSSSASSITDINRFVIDTCKLLKEKKSYLVWNAVGCLGVSAVSDLVKEKNRRKKKKGRKKSSSASSITDINRFVIDTCKLLKEKKSYLVWNAVGCLGVSAVSDLVKEVGAIQHFGGQKTADGKRFRTGGGVLWNILKTREPKAFKEIMAKGKEFEKQFREPQIKYSSNKNDVISQTETVTVDAGKRPSNSSESIECSQQMRRPSESRKQHSSARDRIRVPVAYDDLFEEGEIHEF